MNAIVGERGQVTIPKQIRDRLGIKPKTVLDFHAENGRLSATKVTPADPVAEVRGILKLDEGVDARIARMRGDPDDHGR